MGEKEKYILIEKYLSGEASADEIEQLNEWYMHTGSEEIMWESEEESEVRERIFSAILNKTSSSRRLKQKRIWYSVAASLLLGLSIFSYQLLRTANDSNANLITKALPAKAIENKFILLPDSSIVILKPGSELIFPEEFVGKERKVELTGEGYFDIKHKNNQPFTIQTGKVKTTVLGTAFTIKSINESEIEVFVNRGKVRVENEERELAVLTENRKLIYHPTQNIQEEKPIVLENNFEWEDTNLDFDGWTFSQIAKKLEQRYDVKISFPQAELEQYQLSGTFLGIQNIDEILSILCRTSSSSYSKISNNTYEININHKNINTK